MNIYDKILESSQGKRKSADWFRKQFFELLKDSSGPVRRPKIGSLVYFEYENSNSKKNDRYPLVYVLETYDDGFVGANLHLLKPEKRVLLVEKLLNNSMSIPKNIITKYEDSKVTTSIYPVNKNDWSGSAKLPLEKFYTIKNKKQNSLEKETVWKNGNR